MTGPSLAPILIPIVGTFSLVAWLVLVFRAGDRSSRPTVARPPAVARRPAARVPARRRTR